MEYRIEKDSMGQVQVPKNALYAAQTQRAIDNFDISGRSMPLAFIQSVAIIKKIAAQTNEQLGLLPKPICQAINAAADQIIAGQHADQFPIDIFQTGSGTSTNMNVNEVIAHLASKNLGEPISANDHVNMSQSSNDVIPTAIHLSAVLAVEDKLLPELNALVATMKTKQTELADCVKTGRTHLMDAMPITFGQEISGWCTQIEHNQERLKTALPHLKKLPQGGTAVGTGINAHPEFAQKFAENASQFLQKNFLPSDNFFTSLSTQDAAVALSGQLKTLAVSFMKIANDLRWMNSGPLAGIAEIELKALQPGSSIMPGKVNPVIPEAVAMVSAQVMGCDSVIQVGGASGNFQLNVMLPVIADNLLYAITLLANAAKSLNKLAIAEFVVSTANTQKSLSLNPILVTALNPIIGYLKAAEIAKQAYKEKRPILEVALEQTDLTKEQLNKLLDPKNLTQGGIQE